jgi:hypothetical protein
VGRGPGIQPPDGRGAHPPLGLVQHPLDRHLVDRVDDRPQVGDRVLDLLAVVEPGAAEHPVGDADPHELLFQDPALRVGAVEDGDVAPAQAATVAAAVPGVGHLHVVGVVEVGHLAGDPLGLVDLVVGVIADDGVAGPLVGPQLLRLAADVVGDDGVGGVEDGLGRPVVLLEQDHRGVGERVLELHDVAHVGAPKGVNAVVDKDTVGDVRVGRLHLQVMDGAVVVMDLDRIDAGLDEAGRVIAVPYEDLHPVAQVGKGHEWVDLAGDDRPPADIKAAGRGHRPSERESLPVVLVVGLDPIAPGLAGTHGDTCVAQPLSDRNAVRRPLHSVVPDVPTAAVGEHRQVDGLTAAPVRRRVVGKGRMEVEVFHHLLGGSTGIDFIEQPGEPLVVHGEIPTQPVEERSR